MNQRVEQELELGFKILDTAFVLAEASGDTKPVLDELKAYVKEREKEFNA